MVADNLCVGLIRSDMVELRGIEQKKVGSKTICSAVVRVEYPDIYEKKELFRHKPANRGQVIKAISKKFNVPAGEVIWPRHIKINTGKGE